MEAAWICYERDNQTEISRAAGCSGERPEYIFHWGPEIQLQRLRSHRSGPGDG